MPLTLTLRAADCTPLDFRGVTPDAVRGMTLAELLRQRVRCGNRALALGNVVEAAGDPADALWRLEGDWSHVHHLGEGMAAGEIVAAESIGRHAGAAMRGGSITIAGEAGDWLGAEMRGGLIRVTGEAGDHAGGAYPGSHRGMRGGVLLIDGHAGAWLGERMRRGLIAVSGDAGVGLAAEMLAGTVLLWGSCQGAPGVGMRRGTLGLFGPPPELSTTFVSGGENPLPMWPLLQQELRRHGFAAEIPQGAAMRIVHGDSLHGARGEVLLAR